MEKRKNISQMELGRCRYVEVDWRAGLCISASKKIGR
jgi:hypothetical protein